MARFKVALIEYVRWEHTGYVDAPDEKTAVQEAHDKGYMAFEGGPTREGEGQLCNNVVVSIAPVFEGFMGNMNAKFCERCKRATTTVDDTEKYCGNCGNQLKFAKVYDKAPTEVYRYVDGGETIRDVRERDIQEHHAD